MVLHTHYGKIFGILGSLLLCVSLATGSTQKTQKKSSTVRPAKASTSAVSRNASSHSKSNLKVVSGRSSRSTAKSKSSKKGAKIVKTRGQQNIGEDRAREIQEALIRAKYLDGEATGSWDQRTKDAMTRFQADNGWQTKILPDSRALIKLGLGPNHTGLVNSNASAAKTLSGDVVDSQPGGSEPR